LLLNIEADRSIKHSDYKCPTKVGTIYKLDESDIQNHTAPMIYEKYRF